MEQYLNLVKKVVEDGCLVNNRTKIRAYATFGGQMVFDLNDGFPLLTTKKVHFHSVLVELLWFIQGNTNIKYLVDHNVGIWNHWPYQKYCQNPKHPKISLQQFVHQIKTDHQFAKLHGDLGPVYGKQWRNAHGVDQLQKVINEIRTNPTSRRLIVCSWVADQVEEMLLPPCHCLFQFQVIDGVLSCHLYQRSADLFLGVPFNIASYALLLSMVAHICQLKPGKLIHSFGDLHLYENHLPQIKTQLTRQPYPLCQLQINREVAEIDQFLITDFQLLNYQHHPLLQGEVAL